MEWYHVAIIIVAILAIDRLWFLRTCKLRHNPVDDAIKEIKADIRRIWDFLNEKL